MLRPCCPSAPPAGLLASAEPQRLRPPYRRIRPPLLRSRPDATLRAVITSHATTTTAMNVAATSAGGHPAPAARERRSPSSAAGAGWRDLEVSTLLQRLLHGSWPTWSAAGFKPAPHTAQAQRKVGWLELFDLVYVATIIQLGTALSSHVSLGGALGFAGDDPALVHLDGVHLTPTASSGRHRASRPGVLADVRDCRRGRRHSGVFEGHTAPFAPYAAVRLVLVAMYARTWWQLEDGRAVTRRYTLGFAAGVVLWASSALVPAPWVFAAWALILVWDMSVPLARAARVLIVRHPPDVMHMSERYGILTLIVLGESFVKVLTDLADRGAGLGAISMGSMLLFVVCSLWWIYFDDVAGSRIRAKTGAPLIWVYSHCRSRSRSRAPAWRSRRRRSHRAPPQISLAFVRHLALAMLAVGPSIP
jgi:hypothetical protein